MTTERKPWGIRPGDPTKIGTSKTADGYNFAVQVSSQEPLELLFYKKGSSEPEQIIQIPESCRTGNIYAVTVLKHGLSLYEYSYRQDEKVMDDMAARIVCSKEAFGSKADTQEHRYRVLKETAAQPLVSYIPYEDMVM